MVKRATPVASFILAFFVFLTLSSPVIQSQSAVEEVFHEVDSLRLVDEPIGLGLEAFAKRLEAARISGREPLGLVLAGGSARAYAHIGVLEVLEAHGIYPDFIVANSMGAVIGMLYAAGLSPAAIGELVREVPSEAYLRLVFPSRGGLINGDAFVGAIERIIGPLDISQTKIPIIVTAEDLKTRRQVEMAQGDFSRIMATTFAMPAIFEPVPLGDFLLIDGGVTNIVPLEIAARYSKNLIVSTALYDKAMTFDNPLSVINRAIDIGKTRAGMRNLLQAKPMVIRNEVEDISYMEFATPGRIIEIGKK
ncbi:MAG: NTE family protein, partial [Spirochaetes bacterium]